MGLARRIRRGSVILDIRPTGDVVPVPKVSSTKMAHCSLNNPQVYRSNKFSPGVACNKKKR